MKTRIDWSTVATSVTASVLGNIALAVTLVLAGRFAVLHWFSSSNAAALPPALPPEPPPQPPQPPQAP